MNYRQMTAHSCRTTFQPCFDPSMLPQVEVIDDGYVSQQINAMTVWRCLIDHGEMDAQAISEKLGTTPHLVGLFISPMKKNGNVVTTRKKTRGVSTRYTATLKSPLPSPVYQVRSALKKNPGATVAGLCALAHLESDQVRSGIKQLIKENLVSIHCTYPKTYSLKGTA